MGSGLHGMHLTCVSRCDCLGTQRSRSVAMATLEELCFGSDVGEGEGTL